MYEQLVDFTSRILKVDAGYFFRNGFWVSFRYAFVSIIGLATTIVFTRMTSQEVYGAYQYILSFVAFLSFLSLPGMNIAALRSVVKGNDAAVFSAMRWSFISALIGIPCILAYGFFHSGSQEIPLGAILFVAAAFAPFYAFNTWYVFYEGRRDFFSVAWRSILVSGLSFTALWIALSGEASLTTLVVTYFLTGMLLSICFSVEIWLRSKRDQPQSVISIENTLDIYYGLSVTGQKFIFSVSETLPLLIIGYFYGFAEVAVFQVAFFVYSSVSGYVGAIASMYLPKFFSGIHLNGWRVVSYNMLSGIFIIFVVSLFLFVVFPQLFDDRYTSSAEIVWLLLPAVLLLPLKSYLATHFTASKRVSVVTSAYVLANAVAIIVFSLVHEQLEASITGSFYVNTFVITVTAHLAAAYFLSRDSRNIDSI